MNIQVVRFAAKVREPSREPDVKAARMKHHQAQTLERPSLRAAFQEFLAAKTFPCVGAKSALAHSTIETVEARDIRSAWDDLAIHQRLCQFGQTPTSSHALRSFAVLFAQPHDLSEVEFERHLWARLQSLCDKDRWLSYKYDPDVEADPQSPEFAFSVGGVAYFVVGMHPRSNRLSRRTPMPVLVFNPFAQFQELRARGAFNRMAQVTKKRDADLCGSENPMLADHGSASAARQFSGRRVTDDWICPFAPTRSV